MDRAQEVERPGVGEGLIVGGARAEDPAVDVAACIGGRRGVLVAVAVLERDRAADRDRRLGGLEDTIPDRDGGRAGGRLRGAGGRSGGAAGRDDPTVVPAVVSFALVEVRVGAGRRDADLRRLARLEVARIEPALAAARPHPMPLVVAVDEPDDVADVDAHVAVAQPTPDRDRDVRRAGDLVVRQDGQGGHQRQSDGGA